MDGHFYRVQILKQIAEERYQVQFIDYGDCRTVGKWQIFPLQEQFTSYPAMAVKCSLEVPNLDADWNASIDDWAKYLPTDRYNAKFVNRKLDKSYIVQVNYGGNDLAKKLYQHQLAALRHFGNPAAGNNFIFLQ